MTLFPNRFEAGLRLAERLAAQLDPETLILALPRGGVAVASAVSKRLKLPLDLLVIRKIGAPGNPEYGIGALSEQGYFWIDPQAISRLHLTESEIEHAILRARTEVLARARRFRGMTSDHTRSTPDCKGRHVLMIDDGLATGVTARVAARMAKTLGARSVRFATPVGARETVESLQSEFNDLICLEQPENFWAVGQAYDDFSEVSDDDVSFLLYQQPPHPALSLHANALHFQIQMSTPGILTLPQNAQGLIVFSSRNPVIAETLNQGGFGTFAFDVITEEEAQNSTEVFEIPFLAKRLEAVTRWIEQTLLLKHLPLGYFGAGTGAAAALWAVGSPANPVKTVVTHEGRVDLAQSRWKNVDVPVLLIVGDRDSEVLAHNQLAAKHLKNCDLEVIRGAIEGVSQHTLAWFTKSIGEESQKATSMPPQATEKTRKKSA